MAVVASLPRTLEGAARSWVDSCWVLVGTDAVFQPGWAGEGKPTKLSVNRIKRKFRFPGMKSRSQGGELSGWVGSMAGRERLRSPTDGLRPSAFCSASLMPDRIASAHQISELGQSQLRSVKRVHFFNGS